MTGVRRSPAPLLLALLLVLLAAAAPARAQSPVEALYQVPGVSPPGANDPSCVPDARHPYPVILVHGTFGDMTVSWPAMSPALVRDGYCVFALDLVRRGTAPVDESADRLAAFLDEVLARTGAAKASLVGHSQGGMLGRYVARYRGALEKIDDVIGLAPSSHGTTNPLATPTSELLACPACEQQRAGSGFVLKLNAPPDEAPAPVDYTVLSTRHDQVVTPFASQALRAGPNVTNVVLQDHCPTPAEHLGIIFDPGAIEWTRNALGRPGPADPAFVPDCTGLAPTPQGAGSSVRPTGGSDAALAPRVRLGARRTVRLRAGRAPIAVHCVSALPCAGVVDLAHAGRRRGARMFSLAPGRRARIAVRLSSAARSALRRRGRLHMRARATVTVPGGAVSRTSRRVTVRTTREVRR